MIIRNLLTQATIVEDAIVPGAGWCKIYLLHNHSNLVQPYIFLHKTLETYPQTSIKPQLAPKPRVTSIAKFNGIAHFNTPNPKTQFPNPISTSPEAVETPILTLSPEFRPALQTLHLNIYMLPLTVRPRAPRPPCLPETVFRGSDPQILKVAGLVEKLQFRSPKQP